MTQNIIPAGYRLTVDSWENDADSRKTAIVEGLTKERCQYLVDICKALGNPDDYENRICNLYEPSKKDLARVEAIALDILQKHSIDHNETNAFDIFMDELSSLGLSGGGSEFFTRVCELYKVEFSPVDIIFTDVTSDF